ncbi:hypothetical protein FBY33_2078 [Arthrobacter sp. SLBN-112]|nr:hypothetical protein FBY33_2078 [Arthrobacter sp. SLBN-112]
MSSLQLQVQPADGSPSVPVPLRVSAVSMAVSGLLVAATTPLHPDILTNPLSESVGETPLWTAIHICMLVSVALAFVGACGISASYGRRLGRWGQAALAVSFIGTLGGSAVMGLEAVVFPILAVNAPELLSLNGPLLTSPAMIVVGALILGWPLGLSILGVTAAGARVFPRAAGILLAIAAPAFVALAGPFLPVLGVLSGLTLGAAQLWWAWLLWRAGSTPAPTTASALPRRQR